MKILVFRIGSLGDNLIAIPSFWAVKETFPNSEITLLSNKHFDSKLVLGQEVFDGSNLFSTYLQYPGGSRFVDKLLRPFHIAILWFSIKIKKFDVLVYLAPSLRNGKQINRDSFFFKSIGIKRFLGLDGFAE